MVAYLGADLDGIVAHGLAGRVVLAVLLEVLALGLGGGLDGAVGLLGRRVGGRHGRGGLLDGDHLGLLIDDGVAHVGNGVAVRHEGGDGDKRRDGGARRRQLTAGQDGQGSPVSEMGRGKSRPARDGAKVLRGMGRRSGMGGNGRGESCTKLLLVG